MHADNLPIDAPTDEADRVRRMPGKQRVGKSSGGDQGDYARHPVREGAPLKLADLPGRFLRPPKPVDPEILQARTALRRLLAGLAAVLLLARGEEADRTKRDAFVRTGNLDCSRCGLAYAWHASDPFARWLHVLCDGRRVKL